MCRAFFLLGKGNKYEIVCNYAINAFAKGNDEGYFLAVNSKHSIRTLSFAEYMDFIEKHKQHINRSNFVAGHLRQATNKVCIESVHGWQMRGFYCIHNGINNIENNKNENDSFDLFESVFKNSDDKNITISEALKDEVTKRGWGVYMMLNPKEDVYLVASANWSAHFHLIDGEMLVVNSNDDIHKWCGRLTAERRTNIVAFGMVFDGMADWTKDYPLPKIETDIMNEEENRLFVIMRDVDPDGDFVCYDEHIVPDYCSYYGMRWRDKDDDAFWDDLNAYYDVAEARGEIDFEEYYRAQGWDMDKDGVWFKRKNKPVHKSYGRVGMYGHHDF